MKEKQFHNYLNKIFSKDEKMFEMISELNKNGMIFIFGGTVRNFFENGKIFQMPRDVDIVFKSENGNKKILENIVLKYFKFSKNKFNGLKIKSIKGKVLFNLLCNVESFIGDESKIILSTIPFTSSNFKVSLIKTPPKPNPINTISFCLLIFFSFKNFVKYQKS